MRGDKVAEDICKSRTLGLKWRAPSAQLLFTDKCVSAVRCVRHRLDWHTFFLALNYERIECRVQGGNRLVIGSERISSAF